MSSGVIGESTNGMGELGAIVVDATTVTSHTRRVLVECRHVDDEGWRWMEQ